MTIFLAAFLAALVLTLLLTSVVRSLATRFGIVDVPDGVRRQHERPVPRIGGVAVGTAVLAVAVVALRAAGGAPALTGAQTTAWISGAVAVIALGLWDDLRGLSAYEKFAGQGLVSLIVFFGGIRPESIVLASGQALQIPIGVGLAAVTLWIVGITNAFNLIDGSDGVAAGSALFSSVGAAVLGVLTGHLAVAVIGLALTAAVLGFLYFNFPPASVFLGDSGSLFLGYQLGVLGLLVVGPSPALRSLAVPVALCGVPLLDMGLALVRRFLRRDRLFTGDRGHIHHRLRDLGYSPRMVVAIIAAASAAFVVLALASARARPEAAAACAVVLGLIVLRWIGRLGIPELLEVRRIASRGLRQRWVIANNVRIREAVVRLRGAQDSAAIAGALTHAFDSGEFEHVEITFEVPQPFLSLDAGPLQREGHAYRWAWTTKAAGVPGRGWEIRLPFAAEELGLSGQLSLWRSNAGQHLLTDLPLIAREVVPEIQHALSRLERGAAVADRRIPVRIERHGGVPTLVSSGSSEVEGGSVKQVAAMPLGSTARPTS
ncbi:MAG TPA: MraY family glycosyltransferase [Longimicrobiales bacterium]|nr:MraY family glycosyltransferase [Longimicrobiales bacterium]